MLRFTAFENLGLSFVGMSEVRDGDCAQPEPREELSSSLGMGSVSILRQVHGDRIVAVNNTDTTDAREDGDGLITLDSAIPIGVLIADCVPLFLFDARNGATGMIHAGRAGTFANIARGAVRALEQAFGSRAADLHALIGPSAGPCCYEVSQSIADEFAQTGLSVSGRNLDLWQSNVQQLVESGLPPEQIDVTEICTICNDRFHSHRRQPDGARNLAFLSP